MEWQANYAGAALLMPLSRLVLTVSVCLGKGRIEPLTSDAPKANDLTQRVSEAFGVSAEAARVRLIQLGYLTAPPK